MSANWVNIAQRAHQKESDAQLVRILLLYESLKALQLHIVKGL